MPLKIRIRSAMATECNQARGLGLIQWPDNDLPAGPPPTSLGLGSRALSNTTIVLTAKVVARLIALVTVLYQIRKLGQVQYGTFALLVNLTAIVSVVLDLGFNVLFVREGSRDHSQIQRYLRNVMSVRLVMSGISLVLLAALVIPFGLGALLVPAFVFMVLTSYSTLLRNGLYAVQQLCYEPVSVVIESAVLLVLILYAVLTNQSY